MIERGTNRVLYSRGFASIFGEWETTDEAKNANQTFHESLRFPAPASPVHVVLKKRDAANAFREIWLTIIDPKDMFIDSSKPGSPGPLLEIEKNGDSASNRDHGHLAWQVTPYRAHVHGPGAEPLAGRAGPSFDATPPSDQSPLPSPTAADNTPELFNPGQAIPITVDGSSAGTVAVVPTRTKANGQPTGSHVSVTVHYVATGTFPMAARPMTGVDVTTQEDLIRILEAEAPAGSRSSRPPATSPAPRIISTRGASSTAGSWPTGRPISCSIRPSWPRPMAAMSSSCPAGDRTIIDDAHHHDQSARQRAALPRRGGLRICSTSSSRPMTYGFMQRGLRGGHPGGDRLRGDGRVRRPARGSRSSGMPSAMRRSRDWSSPSSWASRCTSAGPSPRSGTALAIGVVARRGALRFDTAVGVLFAGCSPLASSCSARSGVCHGPVRLPPRERPRDHHVGHRSRSPRSVASSCWLSRCCARSCCTRRSIRAGAAASGLPSSPSTTCSSGCIGVTIVVSIQAVGIIMVVAMLVTPAATGELLVDRFWDLVRDRHRGRGRRGRQRLVSELLPERGIWRLDRARRDAVLRACPALLAEVGLDLAAAARPAEGVHLGQGSRAAGGIAAVLSASRRGDARVTRPRRLVDARVRRPPPHCAGRPHQTRTAVGEGGQDARGRWRLGHERNVQPQQIPSTGSGSRAPDRAARL